MRILQTIGICVALLSAPACDKGTSKKSGRPTSAQRKAKAAKLVAPEFFKRIPADAVYAFANYERLDDNFVSAMADVFAVVLEASKTQLAQESPESRDFLAKYREVLTMAGLKKTGREEAFADLPSAGIHLCIVRSESYL